MFKTAVLAVRIAATAFATPAYPGVPSAARGDVTCSDSPTSKARPMRRVANTVLRRWPDKQRCWRTSIA